jgi:hypothetical protein
VVERDELGGGAVAALVPRHLSRPGRSRAVHRCRRVNAIVKYIAIVPKAFVARIDLRRYATDRAAMTQAVRRMSLQMALVGFPNCFGGAAVMPTLFHAWLDSRWYETILPGQIMLRAGIAYLTLYGASAVLYAVNRQGREAGIATVLNLSIVVGTAVPMRFGLVATTAAVAVIPLLLPLPILAVCGTGHVGPRDILLPRVPTLLAAAAMVGWSRCWGCVSCRMFGTRRHCRR